jgi:DNA ligase (NAD+)
MQQIKTYLDFASAEYYAGRPVMSDEVFDRLAESIGYNAVGAKQHEKLKKHYYRMYSLQKYYEDEGVKPLTEYDKAISPKIDGAGASLLYIEGNFVMALQRGDGIEGTDITDKFIAAGHLIPRTIPMMGVLQVIGEVAAVKTIPNARNYAAGALNLKNLEEFKTRSINFFAYGVYPYFTPTYSKDMDILSGIGFNTVFDEGILELYPCDGMVFRIDDNETFYSLGYTAKHPKGAYAKKERTEAVETKILSVEWNVGKSGKVTPVAILEPVLIGDAWVSRATLNNPGFIEMLGIEIGDTVGVVRAGEIIPCITHKVEV